MDKVAASGRDPVVGIVDGVMLPAVLLGLEAVGDKCRVGLSLLDPLALDTAFAVGIRIADSSRTSPQHG
jgi:hypothetical protein